MDKISVVIPTYNSAKTIKECLGALRKFPSDNSIDVEIVIVDAGSTDNTLQIAETYNVKTIVSRGISRGAARNLGVQNVKNDVIVFLDSDCIITPEWARALRTANFDLNTTLITGPSILVDPCSFMGTAACDLLSDRLFTLSSYTFSFSDETKEVHDAAASNIAVSKILFERIGGFPDLNFNEDTLFCQKVINAGAKIIYFPGFKTNHKKTFESVKQFGHYFYQYGYHYSKNIWQHRSLMNRYALIIALFSIFAVSTLILGCIGVLRMEYFLAPVVSYFAVTAAYAFLKTKKRTAIAIPLLALILVFSYISGFFLGITSAFSCQLNLTSVRQ